MKRTISIMALAALVACGGGGGGGSTGIAPLQPQLGAPVADAPAPKNVCNITLYGDSVMRSESTKGPLPFSVAARIRSARPDWVVVDRSVSGDSATLAVPRILNDHRAKGVTVGSWGLNDMSYDWDVKGPLAKFIDFMKAEGQKVVITGLINVGTKPAEYNADELEVATQRGAAFASWGEQPVVTVDGVHPDQNTTDALAEDLINTLDKECAQ